MPNRVKGRKTNKGELLQALRFRSVHFSGKRLVLLAIADRLVYLKQHEGEVRGFDLDPWQHPVEVRRRLGFVAESQAVPAHFTVRGMLDLYRQLYPTSDPALERQFLARLSVSESRLISTLSRGEARKVLLVCATAYRPELLILDEPAGGLKPAARREFLELVIDILTAQGLPLRTNGARCAASLQAAVGDRGKHTDRGVAIGTRRAYIAAITNQPGCASRYPARSTALGRARRGSCGQAVAHARSAICSLRRTSRLRQEATHPSNIWKG